MDGTTLDAEVIRRSIGTLISPAGGIVTPGDCAVAQQTVPNMSVQIGTGQVWVPGTSTATQGPYYSRNGAAITQAIDAASVSNPRVDIVGVQVQDIAYAGAAKQIDKFHVAGTPTAGASVTPGAGGYHAGIGAVPASSLVFAYVLVPTSATSIVTADIENVAPVCGRASGAWQALTLGTNIISFGNYTPSARLVADRVELKGAIQSSASIPVGSTLVTVPSNCKPASEVILNTLEGRGGLGVTLPYPVSVEPVAGHMLGLWTGDSSLASGAVISLDGLSYSLS